MTFVTHCKRMSSLSILLFYILIGVVSCFDDSSLLVASGNPHCPESISAPRCRAQDIVPTQIMTTPLATQTENLQKVTYIKYLGRKVPIYHFLQSRRLTNNALPFKVALMKSIDLEDIVEIQVPLKQSLDSWFPFFQWSVIVCNRCHSEKAKHLGWKFTSSQGESFYALIVDYVEKRTERNAVSVEESVVEVVDTLFVGENAPAWILASLASISTVSSRNLL